MSEFTALSRFRFNFCGFSLEAMVLILVFRVRTSEYRIFKLPSLTKRKFQVTNRNKLELPIVFIVETQNTICQKLVPQQPDAGIEPATGAGGPSLASAQMSR